MNIAEKTCDELDAAVFSGDTFTEQPDLVVLNGYLARWQREASRRLQAIQREREKAKKAVEDLA